MSEPTSQATLPTQDKASDTSTDKAPEHKSSAELHFTFVEFLFGLAVAETAAQIAKSVDGLQKINASVFPQWTHLLLSLILITTSWIGWGKSRSSHLNTNFRSVFSKDYIELLVDVVLVVVYFVLVHLAEVPDSKGPVPTNHIPEVICVTVVFGLYVFWDLLSKWNDWVLLRKRIGATLLCCGLAVTALVSTWPSTPTVQRVITVDLALISLVFLFRAIKCRDFGHHEGKHWLAIVCLFGGFALLLVCG